MRSCITMFSFRKRKHEFDESMDHYRKMCKQRIGKKMHEMDGEFMSIVATMLSNLTVKKTTKKRRSKDVQRGQTWWADGYRNWSDVEFKKKLRLNRETFDFILDRIRPELEKKPTNTKPNPSTVGRQLASTLYRYAHGTSFITVGHLFGISKELACKIFHKTSRAIIYFLYEEFVRIPAADGGLMS